MNLVAILWYTSSKNASTVGVYRAINSINNNFIEDILVFVVY
jgi:hypothetical protein